MIKVTETHIDALYDAITFLRLSSQILSEGEIDDRVAGEISWMLGSVKRRLEPVINLLEEMESRQERGGDQSTDDLLEIGSEMLVLWEKFARRRQASGGTQNGSARHGPPAR